MSDEQRRSIRIDLTSEQREQIKEALGKEVAALDLNAEELEQRIAPSDFSFTHHVDTSSPNLF